MEKQILDNWNKLQEMSSVIPNDEYQMIAFALQNRECLEQLVEDKELESYRAHRRSYFKDPAAAAVFMQLLELFGAEIKISTERIIKWIKTKTSSEIDFTELLNVITKIKYNSNDFERLYKKINLRNEKAFALETLTDFLEDSSLNEHNLYHAMTLLYYRLESNRTMPYFNMLPMRELIDKHVLKFPQLLLKTDFTLDELIEETENYSVQLFWPTTSKIESLSLYTIYQSLILKEKEKSLILASHKDMNEIQEIAFHLYTKGKRKTIEELNATIADNCYFAPVNVINSLFLFEIKVDNLKMCTDSKTIFIKDLNLFDLEFPTENKNEFLIKELCKISHVLGMKIFIMQTHESYKNNTLRDEIQNIRCSGFESYSLTLNKELEIILENDHKNIN